MGKRKKESRARRREAMRVAATPPAVKPQSRQGYRAKPTAWKAMQQAECVVCKLLQVVPRKALSAAGLMCGQCGGVLAPVGVSYGHKLDDLDRKKKLNTPDGKRVCPGRAAAYCKKKNPH